MPSSLTRDHSSALGFSPYPPVSVCGTGADELPRGFSWRHGVSEFVRLAAHFLTCLGVAASGFAWRPSCTRHRTFPPVRTLTLPRHPIGMTRISWCRNVDLLSIGYALRPGLRIRLTLRGLPFLRKPWVFGVRGSRPHCRYLCQQNLFRAVQPSSRSTFDPHGMLLYHSPA